jgi:hypothetical protein
MLNKNSLKSEVFMTVFYKVSFSHLKNFFAKLGHFGFQNQNIKPTFVRLEKLLDLGLLVHEKSFPPWIIV